MPLFNPPAVLSPAVLCHVKILDLVGHNPVDTFVVTLPSRPIPGDFLNVASASVPWLTDGDAGPARLVEEVFGQSGVAFSSALVVEAVVMLVGSPEKSDDSILSVVARRSPTDDPFFGRLSPARHGAHTAVP